MTNARLSPSLAAVTGPRQNIEPSPTAVEVRAHRVLIVDDHRAIRACLRALVEDHPDMTVVGEAGNGEEAVALARELRPDVILMDVRLPRLGGVEATRRIRLLNPAPVVIGLTIHWTPALEADMWDAGAADCLSKVEAGDRLHAAILTARSTAPPSLE